MILCDQRACYELAYDETPCDQRAYTADNQLPGTTATLHGTKSPLGMVDAGISPISHGGFTHASNQSFVPSGTSKKNTTSAIKNTARVVMSGCLPLTGHEFTGVTTG